MNYYKWRRKIKACATTLLLSAYVLWLFLLNEIAVYQLENYIPVEIKYPLSEVTENQAVLTIRMWSHSTSIYSISCMFVVNKEGKWKLVYQDIYDMYDVYNKSFSYGDILQDENIPWQKTKIAMNQELLERAINMPDLESQCHPVYADERCEGLVWHPSQSRQNIYYHGDPTKQDYTLLYLQKKFNQLEELGIQAIEAQ